MSDPCCDIFCGLCFCFACCANFCDPRYGCCTKKHRDEEEVEMDGMDLPDYKAPRALSWSWRLRKNNADDDKFVAEVTREAQENQNSNPPDHPPAEQSLRHDTSAGTVNTQPLPGKIMEHGRNLSRSSGQGDGV